MKTATTTSCSGRTYGHKRYRAHMRAEAKRYWRDLLKDSHHNITLASHIAGLNRTHTYKVLKRLNLDAGHHYRSHWQDFGL